MEVPGWRTKGPEMLTSGPAPPSNPTAARGRDLGGCVAREAWWAPAALPSALSQLICSSCTWQLCVLMRLRRSVRKTLLILITQKQPTGTKDFGCLFSWAALCYCGRRDQISCPHYYYNNKAKMLLQAEGIFLKQ